MERLKVLGPISVGLLKNPENYEQAASWLKQQFPDIAGKIPATYEEALPYIKQTASVYQQMNPPQYTVKDGQYVPTQPGQGGAVPIEGYVKPATSGSSTPYFTPVQTGKGVYSFDARTGKISQVEVGGENVVGSSSDPALQAKLAQSKKTGTKIGEVNIDQYNSAESAKSQVANIDRLLNHLEESEAITGMGADIRNNIERAKALLGSDVASGKVQDTELLDIMMGSEVFPMIKSLGIGARGMDTPAEREFMRKVLTGEISLNKGTLVEMAKLRKNLSERAIKKWNTRVEKGELDTFFDSTGITKGIMEATPGNNGTPADIFSEADRIIGGQ